MRSSGPALTRRQLLQGLGLGLLGLPIFGPPLARLAAALDERRRRREAALEDFWIGHC